MKPSDLMISVLDFFAILLPGSLATWLAAQYVQEDQLMRWLSIGTSRNPPDATVLWTVFAISSYVLGNFVFMAGKHLDTFYDRWRKRRKSTTRDKSYQAAKKLMREVSEDLLGGELSTFKWAKVFVQIHAPAARVEIDRLEADSKFFRSFVVVSIAMTLHFSLKECSLGMSVIWITLGGLSYHRFLDRRWQLTELTYATAALAHSPKPSPASSPGTGP